MKIAITAASLREGSINLQLAVHIADRVRALGHEVDFVAFSDLETPSYNEDDRAGGYPSGAERFKSMLDANDALILVTPEYNYSIAGHLKNSIDWVSRYRPIPLQGVPILLAAASPGPVGGIRGLWATRVPLEGLGAPVYPDMFALALAQRAWNEDGTLADEGLSARLQSTLEAFLDFAGRLRA
jgi:chromate reductase